MEVLAGVLSGASFPWQHRDDRLERREYEPTWGTSSWPSIPRLFMPLETFTARVDAMIEATKAGERMEGGGGDPRPRGDGDRARERNLREGMPLLPSTRRSLEEYRQPGWAGDGAGHRGVSGTGGRAQRGAQGAARAAEPGRSSRARGQEGGRVKLAQGAWPCPRWLWPGWGGNSAGSPTTPSSTCASRSTSWPDTARCTTWGSGSRRTPTRSEVALLAALADPGRAPHGDACSPAAAAPGGRGAP